MKSKLPTSKRQLKKLHAEWTKGNLTAVLNRHTAAKNEKAAAKVQKLITRAQEYEVVLAADAEHKAMLDMTRQARLEKAAKRHAKADK